MVKLRLYGSQTGFDVSESLAISHLSKRHAQILIVTGKGFYPMVAVIASNAFVELFLGKKV